MRSHRPVRVDIDDGVHVGQLLQHFGLLPGVYLLHQRLVAGGGVFSDHVMVLAERIRILAPIGKIEMLGADIGLGHLQLTDLPLQPADAGLVSGLPCVVQQHCLLSLQRKRKPHAQEFQIAAYGFQHLGKLIDLQLQLILRNVLEVSGDEPEKIQI